MSDSVIEIHTSDRQLYKRCRRKYGWASTLRDNLVRIGPDQKAFFIGNGVHFALEDWWGYRRFDHPALAFAAYVEAQDPEDLPEEADEALTLATGMLDYYITDWLEEHPEWFKTLWVNDGEGIARPQVEVEVAIDLTNLLRERADGNPWMDWLDEVLGDKTVEYVTTYDRVVIDDHERLWGFDYKTAATYDELNLLTNPQAGSYDWSMDLFYTPHGYKPEGIIWQQHRKWFPVPPKRVNLGKKNEGFSMAVDQATTYRIYKRAIRDYYGTIPEKYNEMLALLGNAQDDNGDRFVRRDLLRRNQQQRENEQEKILVETLEMLDPNMPLYPNPTKDCSWDCPFKVPCLTMDDGADYQYVLGSEYVQWKGYKDPWRTKVKYPGA